ncbi:HNH endonuclease [Sporosarcina sp. SG10008]|uniref:HNH endonuclease n=1 Tax=Sporosarcina sp. SG10008 TaxID=3373103 RepID=UPI0037DC109A
MVKGRIGQSKFKQGLKSREAKCAICLVDVEGFLIASHIKPWKDCTSSERLDLDNDLLLCPNHDWLFDKGYISFEGNGDIMINPDNYQVIKSNMNIKESVKISLNDRQKEYMAWHRGNYFKNE